MTGSLLRRMRLRVLAAWIAQGAIALGLGLTVVLGAASAGTDWSFVAVMAILFAVAVGAWLRFAYGIPLIVLDVIFGLLGLGIAVVDAGGATPADLVRRFVGGLWTVGGFLGAAALVASTGSGDSATDDIDSTAY